MEFHPLPVWQDAPTPAFDRRPAYRFKASWTDTLFLLDKELRALDAHRVVIAADFDPSDLRRDGMPYAKARPPRHPGVRLSFSSNRGPLVFATDTYDDWRANVRAIALGLEALRAVDRWGALAVIQRFAAGAPLGDGELLRKAFKAARAATHPDRAGGQAHDFLLLERAGRHLGLIS